MTLLQAGLMLSFGTFCDHVLGGRSVEVYGGDQEKPALKLLARKAVTQSFLMECVLFSFMFGGGCLFLLIF